MIVIAAIVSVAVAVIVSVLAHSVESRSALLPAGFVEEVVAKRFTVPTDLAFLPDGRMLIAEKAGRVWVVYRDGRRSTYLDIRDRVNEEAERGLIGIAVEPGFQDGDYLYAYYVREDDAAHPQDPKTVRLSRFETTAGGADPTSEEVVLGKQGEPPCGLEADGSDCIPSDSFDHHGGTIRFAEDGSLFLSTGDGTTDQRIGQGAWRAQQLDSLSGKILRIDPETGRGLADNPFWNGDPDANRSKVWAYGLRNPFRFGLRPKSEVAYAGDVGLVSWEELDVIEAGENYGWPCFEGPRPRSGLGVEIEPGCRELFKAGAKAVTGPLVQWSHVTGGASVTGGVFYTGEQFPERYRGAYFFADFVQGWIRYLRTDDNDDLIQEPVDFAAAPGGPVDIEVALDGSLVYVVINPGEVRRISYRG